MAGPSRDAAGPRPPLSVSQSRLPAADLRRASGPSRRSVGAPHGAARRGQAAPALIRAGEVASAFAALLRERRPDVADAGAALAGWMDTARGSLLNSFVRGLERDTDAVVAAIATPWSTSPVEGQITRLKAIKRSMHGRAGFHLLRQRVLMAARSETNHAKRGRVRNAPPISSESAVDQGIAFALTEASAAVIGCACRTWPGAAAEHPAHGRGALGPRSPPRPPRHRGSRP
jgi:hypothetical protein